MIPIMKPQIQAMVVAIGLGVVMLIPQACAKADTASPRVRLGPWARDLQVGPGMNAAGRTLRDSEFVGQNLSGAIFDGANLYGARFYQCDLSDASFRGAHFTGAHVGACNIEGADFTDAVINGVLSSRPPEPPGRGGWGLHPRDMFLSGEQFLSTHSYKTKDLSNCLISGSEDGGHAKRRYDFRGANLRQAFIRGGDWTESDFTKADIAEITLLSCTITFAQLASTRTFREERRASGMYFGAQIQGKADFSRFLLAGSQLLSRWDDADLTDADITRCVLGPTITSDHLRSTRNYQEGNLEGIRFIRMDLSNFDFSRQNLSRSSFTYCDLTDAIFDDAVITQARFSRHNTGLTIDQIKSTWNYKHGRMARVALPQKIAEALRTDGP